MDNDPNVVQFLTVRDADIDAKDDRGATPLHKAAQYANTKMAAAFIENGADVNALTTKGRTPLDYAYETDRDGKRGLVELLRAAGGDTGRNVRQERLERQ
ncbi:MAG: ankyrin repeat domain-containing protein [Sedimentisphaerales bacterium]|nr:ankyrin repeat domain-containing protein [Sedimentisphaerales bacterium]